MTLNSKKVTVISAHEGSFSWVKTLEFMEEYINLNYITIISDAEYRSSNLFRRLINKILIYLIFPLKVLTLFRRIHKQDFIIVITSPFYLPLLASVLFKNEKLLLPFIELASFLFNKENYLIGSKPNMGIETSYDENDLTSDRERYKRIQLLVRKEPNIRLWGVTNGFAKAVNKRFSVIRKKDWAEQINLKILIINSLKDKVVDSNKTIMMSKRLKNSTIVNFDNCKHEIFMEKNKYREKMWKKIDSFLK